MIKKLISEFYDEESEQYVYVVRITVLGLTIYIKQMSSQRIDLVRQFFADTEKKIGFKNEDKN